MTGPLVSVMELAERLDDPALRIVDTRWYLGEAGRGRAEYAESHIPHAIFLDLERDLSAPQGPGRHPLPDPGDLAATLGSSGIGNDHDVVAYDSSGGAVAARLWWMLRALGHQSVAVLDGGLTAWRAAGLPETATVPDLPAVVYHEDGWRAPMIAREDLAGRLDELTVVDARAAERYRGDVEPIDPVAGHVPSAVNVPYEGNLEADMMFRPPEELRRRFEEEGVSDLTATVVYCGSGVTACHDLLALEVAGLGGAILYPGSWSDWSTAGMPVETG